MTVMQFNLPTKHRGCWKNINPNSRWDGWRFCMHCRTRFVFNDAILSFEFRMDLAHGATSISSMLKTSNLEWMFGVGPLKLFLHIERNPELRGQCTSALETILIGRKIYLPTRESYRYIYDLRVMDPSALPLTGLKSICSLHRPPGATYCTSAVEALAIHVSDVVALTTSPSQLSQKNTPTYIHTTLHSDICSPTNVDNHTSVSTELGHISSDEVNTFSAKPGHILTVPENHLCNGSYPSCQSVVSVYKEAPIDSVEFGASTGVASSVHPQVGMIRDVSGRHIVRDSNVDVQLDIAVGDVFDSGSEMSDYFEIVDSENEDVEVAASMHIHGDPSIKPYEIDDDFWNDICDEWDNIILHPDLLEGVDMDFQAKPRSKTIVLKPTPDVQKSRPGRRRHFSRATRMLYKRSKGPTKTTKSHSSLL
eukprot:CFRG2622T1